MSVVLPFPRWFNLRGAITAACGIVLAGCAHPDGTPRLRRGEHEIRVNATAVGPVKPGTAFVVRATRENPAAESTLLFAEAARQVKGALMARGLYEAPDSAHAAVIVQIDFSMETPRGVPGAASGRTAGTGGAPNAAGAGIDEAANIRATQRGALAKNLVLTAQEAKPAGGGVPRTLWSVELSTTDDSTDLRKYLPLLAASAIDQIGADSGGPKTVRINETDKTVTLIRQSQ